MESFVFATSLPVLHVEHFVKTYNKWRPVNVRDGPALRCGEDPRSSGMLQLSRILNLFTNT